MQPFFIKNKDIIEKFISFSKTEITEDNPNYNHVKLCGDFLDSIISYTKNSRRSFDEYCTLIIRNLGETFINAISSVTTNYNQDTYDNTPILKISAIST